MIHARTSAERVYAFLLRLYPRAFRARFGADLLDLFRDKHRAAASRGAAVRAFFWLRIIADTFVSALAQRLGHHPGDKLMQGVLQDVRYALRVIARRPGLSFVIVITLALGLGANTAIFSLINTVLLRPVPYAEPERLAGVWETQRGQQRPTRPANFFDWKARAASFQDVAWSRDGMFTLTGMGEPESIIGYRFSANMFSVLGVQPALGRVFAPEEDKPGAPRVVVLSDKLWRRRFGADPAVVGRSVTLGGNPHTIIGVMPRTFRHPQKAELWVPIALSPQLTGNRVNGVLRLVGRLKPGVSREAAQTELAALYKDMETRYPDTNASLSVMVNPFGGSGDAKPMLLILFAGVGFVLLIACANVANLLLADAASRRRELAVRSALGASRYRVVRQMLTESVMLALAGGALGAFVTWLTRDALLAFFPENIANLNLPIVEEINVGGRVFGFAFLTSLATGLLFGMLPAWNAARTNLQGALKDGDRGGSASRRTHSLLVVAEVALSVVLLAGALLMVRSFIGIQKLELGFDTERTMSGRMMMPAYKYPSFESIEVFTRNLLTRVRTIPGVEHAGVTNYLPLSGWNAGIDFQVEGRPAPAPGQEPTASYQASTDDYFRAMGIRVINGRVFTPRDDRNATRVVVVNETLAKLHWPGENPVGRRVLVPGQQGPQPYEVIGVVGDVRNNGLEQPVEPEMFFSFWQGGDSIVSLVVRTPMEPAALASAIREAVWSIDRDQPVTYLMPMKELAAESLTFRRMGMTLAIGFGGLALLLAAIGIYGVLSYSVSRRTREIGVRVALGATRGEVAKVVLREGLLMTSIGIAIGVVAALLLTGFLKGMLYGVEAADPLTHVGVAGILLVVALVATWLPARRATAVDPIVALRT